MERAVLDEVRNAGEGHVDVSPSLNLAAHRQLPRLIKGLKLDLWSETEEHLFSDGAHPGGRIENDRLLGGFAQEFAPPLAFGLDEDVTFDEERHEKSSTIGQSEQIP